MKQLTKDNWLALDPLIAMGIFSKFSITDGTIAPWTADEWAERFLSVGLSEKVPENVRELFTVARGTIIYGSLFYPLFALGLEQAVRVTEAAVRTKAESLGIAVKKTNGRGRDFSLILKDLAAARAITSDEEAEWSVLRELRNIASHPESQTLLPPLDALRNLRRVADAINRLFP